MTSTATCFTSSQLPASYKPCNDLGGEGCYYFNARWYDASTGRFITEDPVKDGANWYIYTFNNPLKYIDPTGLTSVDAAYSRNEQFRSSDPVRYYNEKIASTTLRRAELDHSITQKKREIESLYGDTDRKASEYIKDTVKRLATVKSAVDSYGAALASNGLKGVDDLAATITDLVENLPDFTGKDQLDDLLLSDIRNLKEVDKLREQLQELESELEKIEEEIEEYKKKYNEAIDEKEKDDDDDDDDDDDREEPEEPEEEL